MLKRFICVTAIELLIFQSVNVPVVTLASSIGQKELLEEETVSDWVDKDGNASFPFAANDEMWGELAKSEKKEMCQIPEHILGKLSTEQLLELVIQYPFITDIYAYDDPQDGFERLCNTFNGLKELITRKDCKEVVLDKYVQWEIPEDTLFDYQANIHEDTKIEDMNWLIEDDEAIQLIHQDAQEKTAVSIMEMIMAQEMIKKELTKEDVQILAEAIMDKNDMKERSGCYEYKASDMYSAIAGYDEVVACVRRKEFIKEANNLVTGVVPPPGMIYIRTRGGKQEKFIDYETKAVNPPMTEAEAMDWIKNTETAFLIEIPTTYYNCAAYAWLSLDSWNLQYRKRGDLVSTDAFRSDSTYKKYAYPKEVGTVVSWSKHEGVIKELNYNFFISHNFSKEPLVESKLGSSGPLIGLALSVANADWSAPEYYK